MSKEDVMMTFKGVKDDILRCFIRKKMYLVFIYSMSLNDILYQSEQISQISDILKCPRLNHYHF